MLFAVHELGRAAVGAEVEGVGVAEVLQLLAGYAAARAALAVEEQYLVLVFDAAWQRGFNLRQGKVDRAGEMAGGELAGAADVDDEGAALKVRLRACCRDLANAFEDGKDENDDGQGDQSYSQIHGFNFPAYCFGYRRFWTLDTGDAAARAASILRHQNERPGEREFHRFSCGVLLRWIVE